MHLVTPPDAVIFDAQRGDAGGLVEIAPVKDHRLFQAYLDDTEVRPTENFPFGQAGAVDQADIPRSDLHLVWPSK